MGESIYEGKSKLKMTLGDIRGLVRGKTVIDFGCGEGLESVELARIGAGRVIGIDIRDSMLAKAAANARTAGMHECCEFTTATSTKADILICLDSFEHFADPATVLATMYDLLKPGGTVLTSFVWTWYHPFGGHLFSVFPWAHLLFSEEALIRWRAQIRSDGATRFGEVEGGLNQMTIARFEKLVSASPFRVERLELVPIRKLRPLHCRMTREFTTALIRAKRERTWAAVLFRRPSAPHSEPTGAASVRQVRPDVLRWGCIASQKESFHRGGYVLENLRQATLKSKQAGDKDRKPFRSVKNHLFRLTRSS